MCRWNKLFKVGKEELTDLDRSGRKNTRLTLVDAVKDASLLDKYAIRRAYHTRPRLCLSLMNSGVVQGHVSAVDTATKVIY